MLNLGKWIFIIFHDSPPFLVPFSMYSIFHLYIFHLCSLKVNSHQKIFFQFLYWYSLYQLLSLYYTYMRMFFRIAFEFFKHLCRKEVSVKIGFKSPNASWCEGMWLKGKDSVLHVECPRFSPWHHQLNRSDSRQFERPWMDGKIWALERLHCICKHLQIYTTFCLG